MCGKEHGNSVFFVELTEEVPNRFLSDNVNAYGGLVKKYDLR